MNKKGFTLVELLMAMAFFSFILLFVIAGFIQINRSYTRGITVRRVQNSARLIVEDMARALRGSDTATSLNVNSSDDDSLSRLCMGDLRYGWNQWDEDDSAFTDERLTPGSEPFTIVKDYDAAGCTAQFSSDTATLMLDENVKVQYLNIEPISQTSWRISVTVSSFEDFDLSSYGQNAACEVGVGDQFCDVASLETVVSLRN